MQNIKEKIQQQENNQINNEQKPVQTFKKRHTNDQNVYKKMLISLSLMDQKNENQNHNEITSHLLE